MTTQGKSVTVDKFTEKTEWVKCAVFTAGDASLNRELLDALRKALAPLQTRYGSFNSHKISQTPHWLVFFTHAWPEALIDQIFGKVTKSLNCELTMSTTAGVEAMTDAVVIIILFKRLEH